MLAEGLEPRALLDAEAVLLVHHGEPEAPEADALLDERVGADDARDLARRDRRPSRRTLLRRQRRREQCDRNAERRQELLEGHQMLLGEDLRRRHDRRLTAG